MDDINSIVKKIQVDTFFKHLNPVDPYIKFTMESSGNDGSIPFMETRFPLNTDHYIQTSVYRKPTLTDHYLHWKLNTPSLPRKQWSMP